MNNNELKNELLKRLDIQHKDILSSIYFDITLEQLIFGEDDKLEQLLRENDIHESDVDMESLRDLQHGLVNKIYSQINKID